MSDLYKFIIKLIPYINCLPVTVSVYIRSVTERDKWGICSLLTLRDPQLQCVASAPSVDWNECLHWWKLEISCGTSSALRGERDYLLKRTEITHSHCYLNTLDVVLCSELWIAILDSGHHFTSMLACVVWHYCNLHIFHITDTLQYIYFRIQTLIIEWQKANGVHFGANREAASNTAHD